MSEVVVVFLGERELLSATVSSWMEFSKLSSRWLIFCTLTWNPLMVSDI